MPEKMTAPIKLTKQQRNVLIDQISNKSGVTKMALERLTDHYLSQAAQNQDAFLTIREAVKWMRNHQSNLSRAANLRTKETENQLKDVESKLEYFLSAEHSEIMKFGKWVFGALNKSGGDRRQALKERDLIHVDDAKQEVAKHFAEVEVRLKPVMSAAEEQDALLKFLESKLGNKYRTLKTQFDVSRSIS
jgi:hypothetical protein